MKSFSLDRLKDQSRPPRRSKTIYVLPEVTPSKTRTTSSCHNVKGSLPNVNPRVLSLNSLPCVNPHPHPLDLYLVGPPSLVKISRENNVSGFRLSRKTTPYSLLLQSIVRIKTRSSRCRISKLYLNCDVIDIVMDLFVPHLFSPEIRGTP